MPLLLDNSPWGKNFGERLQQWSKQDPSGMKRTTIPRQLSFPLNCKCPSILYIVSFSFPSLHSAFFKKSSSWHYMFLPRWSHQSDMCYCCVAQVAYYSWSSPLSSLLCTTLFRKSLLPAFCWNHPILSPILRGSWTIYFSPSVLNPPLTFVSFALLYIL